MRVNYKLITHISFLVVVTMGLIACGGGGSKSGEVTSDSGSGSGSGGSGSGSGGCVNVSRPVVGLSTVTKHVTSTPNGSLEITIERSYSAVSNTSWTYEDKSTTTSLGFDLGFDLGSESTHTDTFTIANDFISITKSVGQIQVPIVITTTSTYSPPILHPIDKVCEGQTWDSDYDETTVSPGGTDISHVSSKHTIEAVNVQKSSPAGTFTTFRSRVEADDFVVISWVDIKSGALVSMETNDSSGKITSTSTLISKK